VDKEQWWTILVPFSRSVTAMEFDKEVMWPQMADLGDWQVSGEVAHGSFLDERVATGR
jgi:hypothetical protein